MLIAALVCTNAAALEISNVGTDNGILTVTGKNEAEGIRKNVLITYAPGKTAADFDGGNGDEVFNQIKQTNTAEDGSFAFTYNMAEAAQTSGKFTVKVTSENGEAAEKEFYYYTEDDIESINENFAAQMGQAEKNQSAIDEITRLIKENSDFFIIDFEPEKKLIESGKLESAAEIMSFCAKPKSFAETRSAYSASLVTELINNAQSKSDIAELLTKYADMLELDKAYKDFGTEEKEYAAQIIKNRGRLSRVAYFNNANREAAVITLLNYAGGSGAAERIITEYADMFNLSAWSSASADKEKCCKDILASAKNGGISSIEEIQKMINATPSKANGGSGGGGSSSSSGSKGGSSYSVPPSYVTPPEYDETKKAEPKTGGFEDIEEVEWAKESITELAKLKIINGYSDTEFAPNNYVTRSEFAKMLCGCFGIAESAENTGFTDVPQGMWYSGYVSALKQKGIINGISDTMFGAEEYITREDMAVIIFKAAQANGKTFETPKASFADADEISDYAAEAINAIVGEGVMSGYEDGTVRPQNHATRAETAKLVYSAYKAFRKGE